MPTHATTLQRRQEYPTSQVLRPVSASVEPVQQADVADCLRMLAASIAHEVKQPLSGIVINASACLRMLNAEALDMEGVRETAQRTIRDVKRAVEIIEGLCALFVRSEPGCDRVDLNALVLEVLDLVRGQVDANRVDVTCVLADRLPHLAGDRIQLRQVLLNLVRNAVEASSSVHDRPRGITITTRRCERGRVQLSVSDTGVGLRHVDAERLFTPFYTTKAHGMGVGLSVSRSIVESHRGHLWAIPNQDGPGATFGFTIPERLAQLRHAS